MPLLRYRPFSLPSILILTSNTRPCDSSDNNAGHNLHHRSRGRPAVDRDQKRDHHSDDSTEERDHRTTMDLCEAASASAGGAFFHLRNSIDVP